MSDFFKTLRDFLTFRKSEDSNGKKRRLTVDEPECYSPKLRKLNDHKMSSSSNGSWFRLGPKLRTSYIRHFANGIDSVCENRTSIHSRTSIHTRTVAPEVIDLCDDNDYLERTPPRKNYNSSLLLNGHGSDKPSCSNSRSSKSFPEVLIEAQRAINNCTLYLNGQSSSRSSSTAADDHEIYREMLQKTPGTSTPYSESPILSRSREELKTIAKRRNDLSNTTIDLTNDKTSSKYNETIVIKDNSSELESLLNSKKLSPVNSLKKILDTEPYMNPNYIKKLDDDYKSKRQETERLIAEERLKRDKYSEINRENVNLLIESKALCCRIKDIIIIEEPDEELKFPEFSPEQEMRINEALKCRHPHRLFNEKYNLRITGGDLKLLNDKEWLNDELINFYVNMIQERSQNHTKLPKVYAFSTFFYPKLISNGYTSLRRWTKRVDIFTYDIIVVPIHLGFHWCMAIIDFRDKSIRYYDSMLGKNIQCLDALENYLKEERRDKKKQDFDTSHWKKTIMKDIPRQMNGSDCGVFSCTFAEFYTRDAKILFTQEHMPYIRRKMVIEIIEGKLFT